MSAEVEDHLRDRPVDREERSRGARHRVAEPRVPRRREGLVQWRTISVTARGYPRHTAASERNRAPRAVDFGHAGCSSAWLSAPGFGPGGRRFESGHPDSPGVRSVSDDSQPRLSRCPTRVGRRPPWLPFRGAPGTRRRCAAPVRHVRRRRGEAAALRRSVTALPASLRATMTGVSWHRGCPVGLDELRLVRARHWGFDGRVHTGRLVVARDVARPVLEVLRRLYAAHFPIRRMVPVDAYGASDFRSIEADNRRPSTAATSRARRAGRSTRSAARST